MKKLVVFLVLLFFTTAAYGQIWLTDSFEGAVKKATEENKPILVDFFSNT